MKLTRILLVVVLFSLFCFAPTLFSQTESATVSGRITDTDAAVVAGAEVQIQSIERGTFRKATTNDAGIYVFPSIEPGQYHMTVAKAGFRQVELAGLILNVQDHVEKNFRLQVGSASESVTVSAAAPLVNTQDGSVSTVVDRNFAENLPMNGRSFQTLIELTPGVVVTPASYASQGQFSVNGQRADANYFTVDGVSANTGIAAGDGLPQVSGGSLPGLNALGGTNSLVSVDAMQEFRVQTSSFAPEFGRTPGGQVSIVTRSGTNAFHGTLFDYLRNDVLDANNWFADHNGLPKAKDRQNDFGGVLGGPIVKDKTFFFFSYEGLRLRQPQTTTVLVPDLASRQSASPTIQPFLNAFPLPNGPAVGKGLAQLAASFSNPASLDSSSLRLDHALNSKLTLFARYNYSPSEVAQRNAGSLSSISTTAFTMHTLTLGLTAALSRNVSDELRANYSNLEGTSFSRFDNFGGSAPLPDSVLFPAGLDRTNDQFSLTLSGAGSSGIATINQGKTADNEQRQINILDNLSFTLGRHQLKFGVDYRWLSPISSLPSKIGILAFSGVAGGSGTALSGIASGVTVESLQGVTLLSRNVSAYAQDSWKVRDNLTLTYGIRWDIDPSLKGKDSASDPFTVVGLDNLSTLSLAPRGTPLFSTGYGNVAPRAGLAYELGRKPSWESVLRGGFGIFYDFADGELGQLTFGFPFVALKNLFNVPLPLTSQQTAPPVLSVNPPVSQIFVTDSGFKLPRTYQWNVAAEQSLGAKQILSMTYVGSAGRDLLRGDSVRNPNATFQTVNVSRNSATSDYDALQLKFQRRLSAGLQALASYSWAHSLDIASNDTVFRNVAAISNPQIDRGNSDFDVRHSFTGALTYDLPFRSSSKVIRAIGSGWAADMFATVRSALPVDLTATVALVSNSLFTARPNLVPGIPFYLYGFQYPGGKILNNTPNQGGTGCKGPFCTPPAGQQGSLGRNVLRGFGAWQDDFTIRRRFAFTENVGLQFRAEFFNLFNHPNFGNPTNALSSALFGQSTQTLASSLGSAGASGGFSPLYQLGGPRSIQMALKLQF